MFKAKLLFGKCRLHFVVFFYHTLDLLPRCYRVRFWFRFFPKGQSSDVSMQEAGRRVTDKPI